MSSWNSVTLIGRLTRDPETRAFANGGKVCSFSLAINERKKNQATGQWEDEPLFIDVSAFNSGDKGHLADTIEKYCQKGSQICVSGKLKEDKWQDKTTGTQRSKIKVHAFQVVLLGGKSEAREEEPAMAGEERPTGDDSIPF